MASSHHRQTQAGSLPLPVMPPIPSQLEMSGQGDNSSAPQPHLSLQDLKTIAADIKDTLSAAISELQLDIHTLTQRVHEVEQISTQHDTVLRKTTRKIDAHTVQLRELQRNIEDLDNHNLRMRVLPESKDTEQLTPAVTGLFNDLLDRPAQTAINMERIHRTLRPKGRDTDPLRDIICCIVDYKVKEEILRKARSRIQLTYDRADIHIFQDLSGITL